MDQVVVTHTHHDHSPGTRLLKELTNCRVFGWPAPEGAGQDTAFTPDDIPEKTDFTGNPFTLIPPTHLVGSVASGASGGALPDSQGFPAPPWRVPRVAWGIP